jgi:protein TonB
MARSVTLLGTAFLLLTTLLTQAQTPAPAYTGPRYPGGPDSLRALMYRSSHAAITKANEQVVLRLELKPDNTPGTLRPVGDQRGPKSATGRATAAALEYLQAHMPAWEAGTPGAQAKPGKNPTFLLPLNFTAPLSAQPYAYADQEPVFNYVNYLRPQRNASFDNNPDAAAVMAHIEASYNSSLAAHIQRLTRYPAEALRNREQGRVLVYFEVAESGAVENPRILASAGSALDYEVLGAVRSLQPATTPAQLNGKPVRVFYVLPMTFKIQ